MHDPVFLQRRPPYGFLEIDQFPVGEHLPVLGQEKRHLVGRKELAGIGAAQVGKRHAPLRFAGSVHQRDPAIQILDEQRHRDQIDDLAQMRLVPAQCGLCLHLPGDVTRGSI